MLKTRSKREQINSGNNGLSVAINHSYLDEVFVKEMMKILIKTYYNYFRGYYGLDSLALRTNTHQHQMLLERNSHFVSGEGSPGPVQQCSKAQTEAQKAKRIEGFVSKVHS